MEEKTGIVVKISESFNIKLERYLIDLKEAGVKKTKSELISELAELALHQKTVKKS